MFECGGVARPVATDRVPLVDDLYGKDIAKPSQLRVARALASLRRTERTFENGAEPDDMRI